MMELNQTLRSCPSKFALDELGSTAISVSDGTHSSDEAEGDPECPLYTLSQTRKLTGMKIKQTRLLLRTYMPYMERNHSAYFKVQDTGLDDLEYRQISKVLRDLTHPEHKTIDTILSHFLQLGVLWKPQNDFVLLSHYKGRA